MPQVFISYKVLECPAAAQEPVSVPLGGDEQPLTPLPISKAGIHTRSSSWKDRALSIPERGRAH